MATSREPQVDAATAIAHGRRTLEIEAAALKALPARIGDDFVAAVRLCLTCSGRVVVTGMGKSGHIGGKIAATLASTGTPAFFVHPGEASHGDLGMITRHDAVIAISYSGESSEIITILPLIRRLGLGLITLTGNSDSTLARAATINLDVSVAEEACPLNLAPTASTTATLAMGDALAVALLELRGFTREDFARSHPGGSLGKRLLLTVADIMRSGEQVPKVRPEALLRDALFEMTGKGLGMTAIADANERTIGIFTDGDLRRTLDQSGNVMDTAIGELIKPGCKTIGPDAMAVDAVKLMEQHKITSLLVTDGDNRLVGALNVHDLLRAGVM